MLIRKTPSWHLPESSVTPEHVFHNRRGFLSTAGSLALAMAAVGCGNSSAQSGEPAQPDPSASLYPFARNNAYKLDRDVTKEDVATSYNNYYEFGTDKGDPVVYAKKFPVRPWQVSFDGMVEKPFTVDIDTLIKAMPHEERLYRHRCVEAWSMAVPWSGFPMKALIDYAKPLSGAKYVAMASFLDRKDAVGQKSNYTPFVSWPYLEGLTMAEATNDLAFMVTGIYGKPLPPQNGSPLRVALPWKYGFKSAKGLVKFTFTDSQPRNWWNLIEPHEYGFFANVNPQVPHPRWSQAMEDVIGTNKKVPTLLFNGYGEQVASLYPNYQNTPSYFR